MDTDETVRKLRDVEVLDPDGNRVRLGSCWEMRPALLVMIRHFGCIFCKQQVAEFTQYVPRIHAAGAELIIIGNGQAEHAKWFVEDYGIETPVFTDPELVSQHIVGARRQSSFDPRPLLRALTAWRHGFRQTKTMGPGMMLGGVFVVTPEGHMPYRYLSRFAGDHPSPDVPIRTVEKLVPERAEQPARAS